MSSLLGDIELSPIAIHEICKKILGMFTLRTILNSMGPTAQLVISGLDWTELFSVTTMTHPRCGHCRGYIIFFFPQCSFIHLTPNIFLCWIANNTHIWELFMLCFFSFQNKFKRIVVDCPH